MNITGKKVVTTIVLLAIGLVVGYLIAGAIATPTSKETGTNCLTIQDLNRQDMIGVIQLSRFCEGLGLASNVLWQKDASGNDYALPVCVPLNK